MAALQPYKIFDTLNVQMGNNNQTVGNKGCFGSRIDGTQKFTLKDSNNSETLTLDNHSRMLNISLSISSCGRERQGRLEEKRSRQRAAADKIIGALNTTYGESAVVSAIAQAKINPNKGLRLNDLALLQQFLEPGSQSSEKEHKTQHHTGHKTVHPVSSPTTSTDEASTSSDGIPAGGKKSTVSDSPPTDGSQHSNIDTKKSEEKSARNIVEHFIQQSHSPNITRENVIAMINEEYQSSGMVKGPIAYSHALIENIQHDLQDTLKNSILAKEIDPRDQNTQVTQLRTNRRICLLNTALLSVMLEEKGKNQLETKKMAQDIIGTIIIKCPSNTITFELVHDFVVKATAEETKFNYNIKFPYYLSNALSDFLMDKSTSLDEKIPFLKRFTALNTLLTSSDVLHRFQSLGCLTSPPELIAKTPIPNTNTIASKTPPPVHLSKTLYFETASTAVPTPRDEKQITTYQSSNVGVPPAQVIYSQHPLYRNSLPTAIYSQHPYYYK